MIPNSCHHMELRTECCAGYARAARNCHPEALRYRAHVNVSRKSKWASCRFMTEILLRQPGATDRDLSKRKRISILSRTIHPAYDVWLCEPSNWLAAGRGLLY